MVFARLSHRARLKARYAPIVDEVSFLKFVCVKMKSAYPDFIIAPDPGGGFALAVQAGHPGASCLIAKLCDVFADYTRAGHDAARQMIIERFLSAIGNTVFNMAAPISPEKFVVQLCPQSDVRPDRGEIYLPFIGDLVAGLMQVGDGVIQPVTHANVEVLGMSREKSCAIGIKNVSSLTTGIKQDFEADWPGLVFFSAEQCSPYGLIYHDHMLEKTMPDGAYFICDRARYAYASAHDEASMTTLIAYQQALKHKANRAVSQSLLIRQNGNWHVANLTRLAQAA